MNKVRGIKTLRTFSCDLKRFELSYTNNYVDSTTSIVFSVPYIIDFEYVLDRPKLSSVNGLYDSKTGYRLDGYGFTFKFRSRRYLEGGFFSRPTREEGFKFSFPWKKREVVTEYGLNEKLQIVEKESDVCELPIVLVGKGLEDGFKPPSKGSEGAAGIDLHVPESFMLYPGNKYVLHTGVSLDASHLEEYFYLLTVRSSAGVRDGIYLLNTIGIIDRDYQGEIIAHIASTSDKVVRVEKNDRILQLIPVKYGNMKPVVREEHTNITERSSGGFGSTGN